jgi:hypothetical protein
MDEMYKMLARERQADVDREAANAVLASAGRGLPRALQRLPQGRRLLRLVLRVVGVAIVLGLAPEAADAAVVPPKLNDVAHVYSLGIGEIRCATTDEWNADFAASFGSAHTNLRGDYSVLSPTACEGALNVANAEVPLWQQALGALVLTHEAFHLRHWRFRGNEAKVECQAMVYFTDAAERLGATPAGADLLYPYTLALHAAQITMFPRYNDPKCVIPAWSPPFQTISAEATTTPP